MTTVFFKRTVLSAAIIGVLGLTACGGGGGGSSSSDSATTPATTSGTAAKGILKGATVTAVELASNQTVTRTLATATTNEFGAYTLTIPTTYTGGSIKLTVTSTADTQMKCDANVGCGTRSDGIADLVNADTVDFGEWYKPGAGQVTMDALIASAASGAKIDASITPFTNMAAQRAFVSTNLNADAVANANSAVSALLGVNILTTKPIDITAPADDATPQQKAYAALSAAIVNMSFFDDTTNVPVLNAALEDLAEKFKDGTFTKVDLLNITTQAENVFDKTGLKDESGLLKELRVLGESAGETEITPKPSDNATVARVDKAKAFVSDFRTYANELDTVLNKLEFNKGLVEQTQMASELFNGLEGQNGQLSSMDVLDLAKESTYQLFDQYIVNSDEDSGAGTETIDLTGLETLDGLVFKSGTVVYTYEFNHDTGVYSDKAVITNAIIAGHIANLVIESNESGIYRQFEENEAIVQEEDYTFSDKVSGTINSSAESTAAPAPTTKLTILDSSSENGSYRDSYQNGGNDDNIYSGEFTERATQKDTYTVKFEYTALNSTTPLVFNGDIEVEALNRYSNVYSSDDNGYYSDEYETSSPVSLALTGDLTYGTEKITLNATVAQPNLADFIDKESLVGNETATNYLKASASLGLTVDLKELTGVKVNLSAQRTALDKANMQLSLVHGKRSVLMSFASDLVAINTVEDKFGDYMGLALKPTGNVTVTNLDGVKLVFVPNFNTIEEGALGNVTLDGIVVASLTKTKDGLIKTSYSDGTFEIF